MKGMIRGIWGSFLIYLALPDVGLNKPQTVLIIIVGWMLCTALIWWIEELVEKRAERRRKGEFREFLDKITL